MSRFTWREYLLIGGLLIIWVTVAFFSFQALGNDDINTVGLAVFLGVICTGALLILIAFVGMYRKEISQDTSTEELPAVEETPTYIPERGGLEFYTIDTEGDLVTLEPTSDLADHSVLILINSIVKRIFLIKLNDSAPQRFMFLAGRSASNLNTNRFKNEFAIRNVSDPIERELILEKIGIIQKIGV